MARTIDLNADLGEGCGSDAALMAIVSSCNIACGGHAGNEASMIEALRLAREAGVRAGAHPSFPDRDSFGRAPSDLAGTALADVLEQQVGELVRLAAEQGVTLAHLKPHGALYNMAARDAGLATVVTEVTARLLPSAALVGPPASKLTDAAARARINFVAEGFADRAYEADGTLRQRGLPGAVLSSATEQARQALEMVQSDLVQAHNGAKLALRVDTICLHGDTPGARDAARQIRAALEAAGFTIAPP